MKKLFVESDITKIINSGQKTLTIGKGDLLTPLAIDKLRDSGIIVERKNEFENESSKLIAKKIDKRIVIGSDHTGFKIKNNVFKYLENKGWKIEDIGTADESQCDYPDFAHKAALKIKNGEADFGILVDATGSPSAITANKVKGIRAAVCYNEYTAKSSREHNNANMLCLGAKSLGEALIFSILEIWLNSEFLGERHQQRLDKITAIENKYFNK